MLKNIDLNKTVSKEEYKSEMEVLSVKLGELQRLAKTAEIPIMLVFEGWDAAGKGTLMNKVLQALDPRGFNVYPTKVPTENEKFHPFLWRFWIKTPPKGRIVFFDRSWYRRVTIDRLDNHLNEDKINSSFEDIINFERLMSDSGSVIIKFFLHISKKEQMRRFQKLQNDPATEWRVTKEDLHSHHYYHEYVNIFEDMIERTNAPSSPWVIIEANNKRYAL
jgi:AMP-polyphosphate phosphotransferase